LKKKLNNRCAMLKYGDANSGCLAKAAQKNVVYAANTNKEESDIMKNRSVGARAAVSVARVLVGYILDGIVIMLQGILLEEGSMEHGKKIPSIIVIRHIVLFCI
jgi:hypothetical protein